MMKRLWFALLVLLSASTVVAQTSFDLATLGLGVVFPQTVEIDGNPATTEWAVTTLDQKVYIVNPATGCKEELVFPKVSKTSVSKIVRVDGRDHVLVFDIDASDGKLPARLERIQSVCYPE